MWRPRKCDVYPFDKIDYKLDNLDVILEWDHTTPDILAILSGQGVLDWGDIGGNTDPGSTGGTGDIILTTTGSVGVYDITIYFRPQV